MRKKKKRRKEEKLSPYQNPLFEEEPVSIHRKSPPRASQDFPPASFRPAAGGWPLTQPTSSSLSILSSPAPERGRRLRESVQERQLMSSCTPVARGSTPTGASGATLFQHNISPLPPSPPIASFHRHLDSQTRLAHPSPPPLAGDLWRTPSLAASLF